MRKLVDDKCNIDHPLCIILVTITITIIYKFPYFVIRKHRTRAIKLTMVNQLSESYLSSADYSTVEVKFLKQLYNFRDGSKLKCLIYQLLNSDLKKFSLKYILYLVKKLILKRKLIDQINTFIVKFDQELANVFETRYIHIKQLASYVLKHLTVIKYEDCGLRKIVDYECMLDKVMNTQVIVEFNLMQLFKNLNILDTPIQPNLMFKYGEIYDSFCIMLDTFKADLCVEGNEHILNVTGTLLEQILQYKIFHVSQIHFQLSSVVIFSDQNKKFKEYLRDTEVKQFLFSFGYEINFTSNILEYNLDSRKKLMLDDTSKNIIQNEPFPDVQVDIYSALLYVYTIQ